MTKKYVPFLCLLAVGIMEFLFVAAEPMFSSLSWHLIENYLIIPVLLFFGYALGRDLPKAAQKRMLLSGVMICWFVAVQIQRKMTGMDRHPMGTFFLMYLLAFPFADVTNDIKGTGLKLIGRMLIAASVIMAVYAILLVLDVLPAAMREFVFLDGARINIMRHPNITAAYFLMGIGFTISLFFQSEKRIEKVLLLLLVPVQFVAVALTNCRTALLLICAMFGGTIFFLIWKNSVKQFVAGLLAASVVMAGSFWISGQIFQKHNDLLIARITTQLEKDTEADAMDGYPEFKVENGEVSLVTHSGQSTLVNDFRSLNGRTTIWKSALRAVRDDPSVKLWGTEYAELLVSAYNPFPVGHSHNAWVETLMRLGVPGLVLSLIFTVLALGSCVFVFFNHRYEIWQKIIAMLMLCVMVSGVLEPYLFITKISFHVMDFVFFLCLGYMLCWSGPILQANEKQI